MYLWVDQDKILSAQNIRDNFLSQFSNIVGPKLSTKNYRHVAIAFMEKHLKGYLVEIAFHLQAGHSLETAMMHYANSNLDLVNVDRNSYEAFSRASYQWQQLLGLEPAEEIDLSPQSSVKHITSLNQKIIAMDQSKTIFVNP